MKKRKTIKRIINGAFLFIAMAIVLPLAFHSCQQDELFDLNEMYAQEGYESKAILFPYIPTVVFPEVFVGPATFYPAKGRVQTQTVVLENEDFASFQSTFALVIQNGDGGSNTAQSVTVSVNGIQEFSSNNLRRNPLVITQMIYDLGKFTTIDVEVKGKDGSYVTLWIEGTKGQAAQTFTDPRDGREYKTVTLGSQTWMAENLAYLPEISALNDPSSEPRYYVHGYFDTDLGEAKSTAEYGTYGALYNWGAATTACPPGWRLPTEAELGDLEYYLKISGLSYEGAVNYDQHAKALAGKTNWSDSEVEGSPGWMPELNNSSGFYALPGGGVSVSTSKWTFYPVGNSGLWWTSTLGLYEYTSRVYYLYYEDPEIGRTYAHQTGEAYSVRCIKE